MLQFWSNWYNFSHSPKIFKTLARQLLQGKALSIEDAADILTLKDNTESVGDFSIALHLLARAQVGDLRDYSEHSIDKCIDHSWFAERCCLPLSVAANIYTRRVSAPLHCIGLAWLIFSHKLENNLSDGEYNRLSAECKVPRYRTLCHFTLHPSPRTQTRGLSSLSSTSFSYSVTIYNFLALARNVSGRDGTPYKGL